MSVEKRHQYEYTVSFLRTQLAKTFSRQWNQKWENFSDAAAFWNENKEKENSSLVRVIYVFSDKMGAVLKASATVAYPVQLLKFKLMSNNIFWWSTWSLKYKS